MVFIAILEMSGMKPIILEENGDHNSEKRSEVILNSGGAGMRDLTNAGYDDTAE
ncbi:MAG: hypothetical protein ACRD3B_19565 [Candidatus Sulfotelmatobacter sp.]